jgi:hypothetical protein
MSYSGRYPSVVVKGEDSRKFVRLALDDGSESLMIAPNKTERKGGVEENI